jgi:hypothetical protein
MKNCATRTFQPFVLVNTGHNEPVDTTIHELRASKILDHEMVT